MSDRIIELANELIEALKEEGYNPIVKFEDDNGCQYSMLSLDITGYVHKKDKIFVDSILNNWKVSGELTAKIWEEEK